MHTGHVRELKTPVVKWEKGDVERDGQAREMEERKTDWPKKSKV